MSNPLPRKWSRNPSKRLAKTDDRMLKGIAFKAPTFTYKKNLQKLGGIDGLSPDFGVCWQCWIRITGQGLEDWRREPFSQANEHEERCPLCGYEHWKGRIWFPKQYLMATEIGNPSRRDGKLTV